MEYLFRREPWRVSDVNITTNEGADEARSRRWCSVPAPRIRHPRESGLERRQFDGRGDQRRDWAADADSSPPCADPGGTRLRAAIGESLVCAGLSVAAPRRGSERHRGDECDAGAL